MILSIKRVIAVISIVLAAAAWTGTDITSEKGRADLMMTGRNILQTVDFSLRDGLAQLVIGRNKERTYVVRLDLKETMTKVSQTPYLKLMTLALIWWMAGPAIGYIFRRKRAGSSGGTTPALWIRSINQCLAERYGRVRRVEMPQVLSLLEGVIEPLKFSFAITTYVPRHAAGRRKVIRIRFTRHTNLAV